jgi:hypothetical protein
MYLLKIKVKLKKVETNKLRSIIYGYLISLGAACLITAIWIALTERSRVEAVIYFMLFAVPSVVIILIVMYLMYFFLLDFFHRKLRSVVKWSVIVVFCCVFLFASLFIPWFIYRDVFDEFNIKEPQIYFVFTILSIIIINVFLSKRYRD